MKIVKIENEDGTTIETVIWEENGVNHSMIKTLWDKLEAAKNENL